jgi:hypothetical protein
MFFFRINKIKIFDNKERRKFLGILGKDLAQVKLISFVTTDIAGQLPDLEEFIRENDPERKKEILQNAVSRIVNSRILTPIENVKDNHQLLFGDTGYVLFQSVEIPEYFDWQFIAYESDRNIRDAAQIVTEIVNDARFDGFVGNLATVLKVAASPALVAATEITKFVVNTIGSLAKRDKDDLIGILYMSLNRTEHYPHGERKRDDVPDLTNNMRIDYSIFAFDNPDPVL